MIRLLISGALGKMGQALAELADGAEGIQVVGGVDPRTGAAGFPCFASLEQADIQADVCVDFSHPAALPALLGNAVGRRLPLVLATTGYSAEDCRLIADAATRIPIFQSANMSYGVNVLRELAQATATALGDAFDVEIVERHHNRKIDAPSGTALMLAEAVRAAFPTAKELVFDRHAARRARAPREIGVVAVRGGTVPGTHEVGFYGEDEVILLQHIAQSRRLFAAGALRAARYIAGKAPGLYNMQQLLLEQSLVTHLSVTRDVSILSILGVDASPATVAALFAAIRDINIDMISQTAPQDGRVDVAFSLPQDALPQAMAALSGAGWTLRHRPHAVKLTVEGRGMAHTGGVASRVFDSLAAIEVEAHLITTSETKISLCIDTAQEQRAVAAIREAFGV
jgi:4-hydroxy-tetrahydrodipicolinate reductase